MPLINPEIIAAVRSHKETATPSERLMHHKLRYAGFKVIYQHPVQSCDAFCVADFFIPRKGLIIEVDGGYHDCPEQQRKDARKDALYTSLGYHVLRIRNEQVDTFDTQSLHAYRRNKWLEYDDIPVINQKKRRIKREHKQQKTFKKK